MSRRGRADAAGLACLLTATALFALQAGGALDAGEKTKEPASPLAADAAKRPWLADRRALVWLDAGVDRKAADAAARVLRDELERLGGGPFSVAVAKPPSAARFSACLAGGALSPDCFGRRLAALRRAGGPESRSIVCWVTAAPMGGPEGLGSSGGWMLVSEAVPAHDPGNDGAFRRLSREYTVRHELGHVLGLSHHPKRADGDRCLMEPGGGGGYWAQWLVSGSRRGFCRVCASAATAALAKAP